MEKKLTKKQQEILQKKELIFQTSITLFQKYGYDNVSIKDICNETGISTGSLYNIYENKAAILFQFKDMFVSKCYDNLRSNMNPKNGVSTIISYSIDLLKTFEYIGADMTLQLHLSHNEIFPRKSEGSDLLEQYIQSLKSTHRMQTTLPASQCVDMINIIIYGLVYYWCVNKGDYQLVEYATEHLPELFSFLK